MCIEWANRVNFPKLILRLYVLIHHWRFIKQSNVTSVIIMASRTVVVQLHHYFEINAIEWIYQWINLNMYLRSTSYIRLFCIIVEIEMFDSSDWQTTFFSLDGWCTLQSFLCIDAVHICEIRTGAIRHFVLLIKIFNFEFWLRLNLIKTRKI